MLNSAHNQNFSSRYDNKQSDARCDSLSSILSGKMHPAAL